MSSSELFTFFFGIFWAAMLAGTTRFRPFDSATAFELNGPARRRLVLAFFWLDAVPLLYLLAVLAYTNAHPVPHITAASAIAALGIFGVSRIFAGIVLRDDDIFIDDRLRHSLTDCHGIIPEAPGRFHIRSGLLWLLACVVLAWLVTRIPAFPAVHCH